MAQQTQSQLKQNERDKLLQQLVGLRAKDLSKDEQRELS